MNILVFNHHKYTESLLKYDYRNEHSQHTVVRWSVRSLQADGFNLLFCTWHYCPTFCRMWWCHVSIHSTWIPISQITKGDQQQLHNTPVHFIRYLNYLSDLTPSGFDRLKLQHCKRSGDGLEECSEECYIRHRSHCLGPLVYSLYVCDVPSLFGCIPCEPS